MIEHEVCEAHRPHQSFLQHENEYTRILGIKKEPNGSEEENILVTITVCFKLWHYNVINLIYKKVSFYSLHAAVGNQLLALLMKLSLKFCR